VAFVWNPGDIEDSNSMNAEKTAGRTPYIFLFRRVILLVNHRTELQKYLTLRLRISWIWINIPKDTFWGYYHREGLLFKKLKDKNILSARIGYNLTIILIRIHHVVIFKFSCDTKIILFSLCQHCWWAEFQVCLFDLAPQKESVEPMVLPIIPYSRDNSIR
jgi:hypothetical protein